MSPDEREKSTFASHLVFGGLYTNSKIDFKKERKGEETKHFSNSSLHWEGSKKRSSGKRGKKAKAVEEPEPLRLRFCCFQFFNR